MAELPVWQPLDGVSPPGPSEDGTGRVVALVSSDGATGEGWAPSAALDLCRSWSGQGARVMLVDAGLESPSLHTAADVANREGLVDAVLYGASIEKVARTPQGAAHFLVTAGAPVAEPASIARNARWDRIREGMQEAGVTLVLYLPAGDPGTAAFLGSVSDIVVLSDSEEALPLAVLDLAPMVRARAGLGGDPSLDAELAAPVAAMADLVEDESPFAAPDPAFDGEGVSGADSADGAEALLDPEGAGAEGMGAEGMGDDPGLSEPTSLRPVETEGRGGGVTMILFVILAVIAAGALGWFMVSGLG